MNGLKLKGERIPTIGRMAFLFRSLAFTFYSFVVIYHNYSLQIRMIWSDYLAVIMLMTIPSLFVIQFYKKKNTLHLHVEHAIYDLFIIGLIVGTINLSPIPSIVAITAGITNYIGLRGVRKLYRIGYIIPGILVALVPNNFEILLESNSLLKVLSFTYGIAHFVILSYISYVFANKFYKSNKALKEQKSEINRQHEEIQQQAEELKALNSSLNKLNSSLEYAIEERTKELKKKNIKLAQYTFLNAHKLRAPLARVIGLIDLFNYRETIQDEEDKVFGLLKQSADELEKIVADINTHLEKDLEFKDNLTVDDESIDNG